MTQRVRHNSDPDEAPRRKWSVNRVYMWLRNTLNEAMDDLDPKQWPELVLARRTEADETEKLIREKGNGNVP